MKRLPYIDEYDTAVAASRDTTWDELLRFALRSDTEAMPGFAVAERVAPEKLALRGRHWFSKYELVFLLDDDGPSRTILRAQTWAEFPGLHGTVYRALVIGSGGHRFIVRRMLVRIAARATAAAVH